MQVTTLPFGDALRRRVAANVTRFPRRRLPLEEVFSYARSDGGSLAEVAPDAARVDVILRDGELFSARLLRVDVDGRQLVTVDRRGVLRRDPLDAVASYARR